jgi:hypothetical protein
MLLVFSLSRFGTFSEYHTPGERNEAGVAAQPVRAWSISQFSLHPRMALFSNPLV